MALVRRLVELGRSARASSGVKTRQPLGRALVGAPGWAVAARRAARPDRRRAERPGPGGPVRRSAPTWSPTRSSPTSARSASGSARRPSWSPRPSPPPTPPTLARALRSGAAVTVEAGELGTVELGADDVIVTEQPRSGWAVETGAIDTGTGETVALDLDAHRRAAPGRACSARSSAWCRTPASPPAWPSPTASTCGGPPPVADLAQALRTGGELVGGRGAGHRH